MSDMIRIPTVIMRGGTSKGVFFKANDLPSDPILRDKIILQIFGSPDVRQIDGLGGADSLTSKLAIISPSNREGVDVEYTFGQVSIKDAYIDYTGNCGNISSAVGPFAIDSSMVVAKEPMTSVRIYNTNTGKMLYSDVQVKDGQARVTGTCQIDGVPNTGAEILMDFAATAGSSTGKLLPTGNVVDMIKTSTGNIEVSMVDVANPCVFVRAEDMGIKGTETPSEIDSNEVLLERLEELRAKCCVIMGMAKDEGEARSKSPAFPMIAMVSRASDYINFTSGATIKAADVDFVSRIMYMQMLHKTYPGTGTCCTGAAAKIKGTLVNILIENIEEKTRIRIGHPAGVIPVVADVQNGEVKKAAFQRTARRLMEGYAMVETARL